MIRPILLVSILLFYLPGKVQSQLVTLANTKAFELHSEEVNDTYQIQVSLPFGYEQSSDEYATLYVLDANVTFGMVRDIQLLLSFEKQNPPLIIVGIGYDNFQNWISKRSRDYLANQVEKLPGSGGASEFLSFLENELVPDIEKKFRTNSKRMIYGHSTAALFTVYSMFKSNLFEGYIATSPSVDEDDGFIAKLEETKKDDPLKVRLFLSYGSKEREGFKLAFNDFTNNLKSRNHTGLKLQSVQLKGSHMSSMAPAFVKGLQFINQ